MSIFRSKDKYTAEGYIAIEVKPLLNWEEKGPEGCVVSDKITKEGWKVGYMFREEPVEGMPDSGWRFLKGDEDEDYMSDPDKHHVFSLNTVCNYDMGILAFLDAPVGTCFIRAEDGQFIEDDGTQPICFFRQE